MNFKKLSEITGIDRKETKKAFSFNLAGLFLVFISFLISSCSKNGVKEKAETKEITKETYNLEKTTNPITPPEDIINKKNCGPTPGYPCGTKYYTVSVRDFKLS